MVRATSWLENGHSPWRAPAQGSCDLLGNMTNSAPTGTGLPVRGFYSECSNSRCYAGGSLDHRTTGKIWRSTPLAGLARIPHEPKPEAPTPSLNPAAVSLETEESRKSKLEVHSQTLKPTQNCKPPMAEAKSSVCRQFLEVVSGSLRRLQ